VLKTRANLCLEFGAFLERGHVLPVLPVLGPEVVGIETATNQAGNDGARGTHRVPLPEHSREELPLGRR
jgi:hypothetical protein